MANVGLVDTHSKGIRGHHHAHSPFNPAFLPLGQQRIDVLAMQTLAGSVEVGKEGGVGEFCKEFLFKVGCRHVVGRIGKGEHILEHTAGGSRSGNELHHPVCRIFGIGLPG